MRAGALARTHGRRRVQRLRSRRVFQGRRFKLASTLARWLDGALAGPMARRARRERRHAQGRRVEPPLLAGRAGRAALWRRVQRDPSASKTSQPAAAIAIDLGPDDLPAYVRALNLVSAPPAEPPFLNVQRFLNSIGAAVPEIYVADPEHRMLLVEDVGETSLFQAALDGVAKPATLYRSAVDELLLIHVEGTRRLGHGCIAASIAYDERLFRWEMEDFIATGSASVAPGTDLSALAPELDDLAARLGASCARAVASRLPRPQSFRAKRRRPGTHPGD